MFQGHNEWFRGVKGQCSPSKIFYLYYVTVTLNGMKISFNDVLSLMKLQNCVAI